jgi:hypothetical protein
MYRFKNKKQHIRNSLRYSFKFASIISPGSIKNMTLLDRSAKSSNNIYVKQSYIMLTWLSYIRETRAKKITVSQGDETIKKSTQPSFFIYPQRRARQTLIKAPMAHKTFSQEQFQTKFYTLSISFENTFRGRSVINGVNNSLFLSLLLRRDNLPFESNLFFLKKLRMSITCYDADYMQIF